MISENKISPSNTEAALELISCIKSCCLPKLTYDFDENEQQNSYRSHGNSLRGRIGALRRRIANVDVSQYSPETRVEVVSSILILLHELRSKGPWSPEGFNNYAILIEEAFTGTNNVSLDGFAQDAGDFKQAILDAYLLNIHKKLTAQDWKKYPATVEVYCTFLKQIQEYDGLVDLDPVKILPASLLLIQDFNAEYRIKGLETCAAVLKQLTKENFKRSNYQQVIYEILCKIISEKNPETLKLVHKCLIRLLPLFHSVSTGNQWNQFDTLLKDVMQDIYIETNSERKSICFEFLSNLILIRQSDCIRFKKSFNLIMGHNLDLCTVKDVRKVLLPNLLMALKTWLKYCWIVWKLETDFKIVSLLFKILYIQCSEKVAKKKLDDTEALIVCLIYLCTKDQEKTIISGIQKGESIEDASYTERLKHIVKSLTESGLENKYRERKSP